MHSPSLPEIFFLPSLTSAFTIYPRKHLYFNLQVKKKWCSSVPDTKWLHFVFQNWSPPRWEKTVRKTCKQKIAKRFPLTKTAASHSEGRTWMSHGRKHLSPCRAGVLSCPPAVLCWGGGSESPQGNSCESGDPMEKGKATCQLLLLWHSDDILFQFYSFRYVKWYEKAPFLSP